LQRSEGLQARHGAQNNGREAQADMRQIDAEESSAPTWSEMKTKAGKERKRLPLACIACRRKKIKCSGEEPACKHCQRSRIPCVYKITVRKAGPRTDYMAMLDKRLKRMEERVIRIIPKSERGVVAETGRAILKPSLLKTSAGTTSKKRRFLGDDALEGRQTVAMRDRRDHTGKDATGGSALSHVDDDDDDEPDLLTDGADELPSKELQEHLSETFFDYVYGQSYHLLHKPSYMRMLEQGTVPPVLMLAVCAISARFSDHPALRESTGPVFLRGEQWAKHARQISFRHYDRPSMTILTVYLILGLHEFGTCHGGRSWMFGGMAQRMAYAMQLHTDSQHDPHTNLEAGARTLSLTEREIRRRTMWSCFLMDRFNSSGSERPIFVGQNYIRTPLPIKESMYFMELAGPTEDLNGMPIVDPNIDPADTIGNARDNMGVAAYLIRLVAIWGNLIEYNNLGGKERDRYPKWSSASDFHALKTKVSAWVSSLPQALQYSSDNLYIHRSERTANQFIFLHIIYNQILLFMNHFALTSPAVSSANILSSNGTSKEPMPPEFHAEAARIALSAAMQISFLAHEAMSHNVVAPFSGYAAFFSSTVHIPFALAKVPSVTSQTAPAQVQQLKQAKQQAALSRQCLVYNLRFLGRMKKYWGMFAYVSEQIRELYRKCAASSGTGTEGSNTAVFQYGDWYNLYPHGVTSGTTHVVPASSDSPANRAGNNSDSPRAKSRPDPVISLGQKSSLQTVEEFFASESRRMSSSSATGPSARHKRSLSSPSAKPGLSRAKPSGSVATAASTSPALPPAKMTRKSSASSVGSRDQPRSVPPSSSPKKKPAPKDTSYAPLHDQGKIEDSHYHPQATYESPTVDNYEQRPASSGAQHMSPPQQYLRPREQDFGSLYRTNQPLSIDGALPDQNQQPLQQADTSDSCRQLQNPQHPDYANTFSAPQSDTFSSPPLPRVPSYYNLSNSPLQASSYPLLPMMSQGLDLPTSMFPQPGRPPSTSSPAPNPFYLPQQQIHSASAPNAPSPSANFNFGLSNNANISSNPQHDFYIDPSTAWYMPFNLDPPSAPPQMQQDTPEPNSAALLTSPEMNMGWFDGVSGAGPDAGVGMGMGMGLMPGVGMDGFEWSSAAQQSWRGDEGIEGMFSGDGRTGIGDNNTGTGHAGMRGQE
jgi:hypothetical protein